jgi:hypothetical protein
MTTTDAEAGQSGACRTRPTPERERSAAAPGLPHGGGERLTAVTVVARTQFLCRRASIRLDNGGSPCGGLYEVAGRIGEGLGPRRSSR